MIAYARSTALYFDYTKQNTQKTTYFNNLSRACNDEREVSKGFGRCRSRAVTNASVTRNFCIRKNLRMQSRFLCLNKKREQSCCSHFCALITRFVRSERSERRNSERKVSRNLGRNKLQIATTASVTRNLHYMQTCIFRIASPPAVKAKRERGFVLLHLARFVRSEICIYRATE